MSITNLKVHKSVYLAKQAMAYIVVIFLRATAECFMHLSHGHLSVCLSVCPLLVHCCIVSKWCKLESRNIYYELPQKLKFFCDKTLCHWVREYPSKESVKEGHPPEKLFYCYLLAYMKKIADRHKCAAIITSTAWR